MDFLIEKDGMCLPVEAKSGKNYKTHASLDDLLAVSDYGVARALVISNANVSTSSDGRIRYLPSYYLMFLEHDGLPDETRFTPPIPSESDIIFPTRS